jgi:hydrogenase maturation factor HypF (carbamoyltransferase family)
MKKCNQCNKEYDKKNVNIIFPLQNNMCSECGNLLSELEIQELNQKITNLEAKSNNNPK